ncbi:ISPS1a [Pseudomonas coronafaciens pv. oryzae]|nr:ISPS1a [Pseudomonas coronafaciens pv. oryzae]RMS91457.1 ISPS1a [Pseudomonas coronafaciens pv. oryzae]
MAKLYELSDASWELIKDLVSPEQKMGRPRSDDRLVLHGILWILCSGAAWRDLPERFGPWSTVYQRFRDWRDHGASRIKNDRTFDQFIELDSDFWL